MAKVRIPVESGGRVVKDGSIGKIFQIAAERWKPEAMYFGAFQGQRTAFIVFDMPDPSDMAVVSHERQTLLKTIRAYTRPIATRRLDGPKHCIQTQVVGMPIIRVTHDVLGDGDARMAEHPQRASLPIQS